MRGVGGPLLTIGDLLSDPAVDGGGDDHLAGGASAPSAQQADPSDLHRLFGARAPFLVDSEHYDSLMKSIRENGPSWPSLMLKLYAALKTADKLVSCANTNAQQLLEKVEVLEQVLERGDRTVAAIVEGLQSSRLTGVHRISKSKAPSK